MRGITSNPTIFQKAIEAGDAYDAQFDDLVGGGQSVEASYWDLVTTDIRNALGILRPVYDESDGVDGFVSVEVDPGSRPRHRRHDRRGPTPARDRSISRTST